jgi:hypothetical protein
MSIVYDYLKKIHATEETKAVTPAAPPPVKKKVNALFWVKIMSGILVCLVLGAGLYLYLPKLEKAMARARPVAEKPRVVQPEIPDFNFLLEGIIYNPSKPFAIIDGKMYEKGGRFGDFEVTQITPDTVLLKNVKDNTSHTARL